MDYDNKTPWGKEVVELEEKGGRGGEGSVIWINNFVLTKPR